MIKTILFDVDGVLINTFEGNRRDYNQTLEGFGKKPLSKKEYVQFYSWPAKKVLAHLLPEKSEKERDRIISEGLLKISPTHYKYDKISPHAKAVLSKLSGRFKLGIVTSRVTPKILKFFRIIDYFDAIVCLPDVKNHKPHPEPIHLALKRLDVRPKEAIYIGDAQSDADAARGAGVKVIIYRNPKVKGDFNITDFREIPRIVEKLNRHK